MKCCYFLFFIFFSQQVLSKDNDRDINPQLIKILQNEIKIATHLLQKNNYRDKNVHLKQLESMYELTKAYYKREYDQYVQTQKKVFDKSKKMSTDLDISGRKYLTLNKPDDAYIKVPRSRQILSDKF